MSDEARSLDTETSKALNRLARERAKLKLLNDIRFDMTVCEIEGWDKTEYLKELQEVINGFGGLQERNHKENQ